MTFTETDEPGIYRVRGAGADGAAGPPRPADGFVVNIDAARIRPRPPGPRPPPRPHARPPPPARQPPKRRVELWHGLAALLILLVLVESLLTLRWRRPVVAEQR